MPDSWFPADKSIALRVQTPLGAMPSMSASIDPFGSLTSPNPQMRPSLSTATGVYGDGFSAATNGLANEHYLAASFDVAPADTSTKYGLGAGQLLYGMSALPGGINGGSNDQTTKANWQSLGANKNMQVWYQYALATSGVAPGRYTFKIAHGSMVAYSLDTGAAVIAACRAGGACT